MTITVNEKSESLEESITIDTMIEYYGFDPRKIAVVLNKEIVIKSMYPNVSLGDGDIIEVITFVGGG
ncbi:MAG: sulfur carrier protein ThiS [Eubacteriales bacterium]